MKIKDYMKVIKRLPLVLNENHFRDLIENLAEAVWIIDKDGIILDANIKACQDTGYKKEELVGMDIVNLDPSLEAGIFPKFFRRIVNEGTMEYIGRHVRKDGSYYDMEATATTYEIGGELVNLSTTRNITQRKQYEKELIDARNKAVDANLAKIRFLSNMSHEIRTPMNGFIGLLELLKTTQLDDEQKSYIEMALKSSSTLLELMTDILDYSAIQAGKIKLNISAFNLRKVLEEIMLVHIANISEKKLSFKLKVAKNIPNILIGDPLKLSQIIKNLLNNALKFTDSGEIKLKVMRAKREAEGESITLVFEIHDSGIGISDEVKSVIFQPFMQGDDSNTKYYSGTGLGLAISKELVEAMGGEISVESEIGQGSVFSFTANFSLLSTTEGFIGI